mgnify:FL=1
MRLHAIMIVFTLALLNFSVFSQDVSDIYVEKINTVPDMLQTDREANLPGKGMQYCLPVSVSNSFVWLSENGFERLMEKGIRKKTAQFKVASILGSSEYMNTSLKNGTGTKGLLVGIDKYIRAKGYEYRSLRYQGWRYHPKQYSTGIKIPALKWIKEGMKGKSAVWLNVGWYRYNKRNDEYLRIGGHWVTLVGYGVDENGNRDGNVLIVHDPSPRAGRAFANEYVRLESINGGRVTGNKKGLPHDAEGYYRLTGGMHIKKRADLGILDGVVVLKM